MKSIAPSAINGVIGCILRSTAAVATAMVMASTQTLAAPSAAAPDPQLMQILTLTSVRNNKLLPADDNANKYVGLRVAKAVQPPPGSRFVFIPRVNKDDCDLARIEYDTPSEHVVISQTRFLLLYQFADQSKGKHDLLSVDGVRSLMPKLLIPTSSDATSFDGYFQIRTEQGMEQITDPHGDPHGFWWQSPQGLGVYDIKGTPSSDPTQQVSLPSIDFAPNARWFTDYTDEEKHRAYWTRSTDGLEIIKTDLIASSDEEQLPLRSSGLRWSKALLAPKYQPPAGLEFVSIPTGQTSNTKIVESRYAVDGRIVTILLTPKSGALQVEPDRIRPDNMGILSEEKVEDLTHLIFAGAADVHADATTESKSQSSGTITAPRSSKAAWLNSVSWMQDPGRVTFYWNNAAGQTPIQR